MYSGKPIGFIRTCRRLAGISFLIFYGALPERSFSQAQLEPANGAAGQALFDADEVIEMTLAADMRVLFRDRGEEPDEHPGRISYLDARGDSVLQDVNVRVRGNSRRQLDMCDFPPLRLNFRESAVEGTLFAGQDKLKLVTHCRDLDRDFEQQLILEYLAYKMYGLLSEKSFRTRLVRMTYLDTSGFRRPLTRFGFLIEAEEDLARRNDAVMYEYNGVHQDSTDERIVTSLSIFQYLIGNTDWSIPYQHNISLLAIEGKDRLVPVPYDFDWSGLVDAPYARPAESLRIDSVRERVYRGYCKPEETLRPHFETFKALGPAFIELVQNLEPLDRKHRKKTEQYIAQFYKIIGSSKRINRVFLKGCRRD